MIRRICAYCKAELGTLEEDAHSDERISHGICIECLNEFMAGSGESLDQFLDSLQVPIFVVDADVRVIAANSVAKAMVSREPEEIKGRLGGEVFRCQYYDLPGGCGETIHCQSCTIRNTVYKTFKTGEPCSRVPACQGIDTIAGPRRVRFHISTEKARNAVLLRIDDVQPA